MENLKWMVACKCRASKFEKEYEKIIAVFENPLNAEEFIDKCLPVETRKRFYIKKA